MQNFLKLRKSSIWFIDSLEKLATIIEVLKVLFIWQSVIISMEHNALKCKQLFDTNIYSYLETSGGQSYNLY